MTPFLSPYLNKYSQQKKAQDINYCQHYHSAYELFSDQEKVFAVAARKKNKQLLIQGIIHHGHAYSDFQKLENYQRKKTIIPTEEIYHQLLEFPIQTALT